MPVKIAQNPKNSPIIITNGFQKSQGEQSNPPKTVISPPPRMLAAMKI
jgi:hypothetical protein